METNYIIWNYAFYVLITLSVTIWVAKVLFKSGQPFLEETFNKDTVLATAVNKLLIVGFYLINLGYMIVTIRVSGEMDTARLLIEKLGVNIGRIVLVLGVMHFTNIAIFFSLRRATLRRKEQERARTARITINEE